MNDNLRSLKMAKERFVITDNTVEEYVCGVYNAKSVRKLGSLIVRSKRGKIDYDGLRPSWWPIGFDFVYANNMLSIVGRKFAVAVMKKMDIFELNVLRGKVATMTTNGISFPMLYEILGYMISKLDAVDDTSGGKNGGDEGRVSVIEELENKVNVENEVTVEGVCHACGEASNSSHKCRQCGRKAHVTCGNLI